jgi:hypothetical protein
MNVALSEKSDALKAYFEAVKCLRTKQILVNQKDFTCQIGEWLVEEIYSGKRAISGIQKGWDVEIDGRFIQVKAHAKAVGNTNRWSAIERESSVVIDELIVVVFSPDYKLLEFYKAPWMIAKTFVKTRGRSKPRSEINWSDLNNYKVAIDTLPRQEIVSLFR